MDQACSQCPALRAQISQLQRQVAFLRQALAGLVGGVRGTTQFIDRQLSEPSMPRRELVAAVAQRLAYLIDRAEGKRI